MYGFRKVPISTHGGIELFQEKIQFHHPFFRKGDYESLAKIKRKASQKAPNDEVAQVVDDVQELKSHSLNNSLQISDLIRKQDVILKEVTRLRQIDAKHQTDIKRLRHALSFLCQLINVRRTTPMKRPALMLQDGSDMYQPNQKVSKSGVTSVSNDVTNVEIIRNGDEDDVHGPLITELLSSNIEQQTNELGHLGEPSETFDINSLLTDHTPNKFMPDSFGQIIQIPSSSLHPVGDSTKLKLNLPALQQNQHSNFNQPSNNKQVVLAGSSSSVNAVSDPPLWNFVSELTDKIQNNNQQVVFEQKYFNTQQQQQPRQSQQQQQPQQPQQSNLHFGATSNDITDYQDQIDQYGSSDINDSGNSQTFHVDLGDNNLDDSNLLSLFSESNFNDDSMLNFDVP